MLFTAVKVLNNLRIYLLILVFLCGLSCEKKPQSGIPLVQVDLTVYTTDPVFINLNAVGGYEYISGGSRGILIYRNSNDEFKAFERHCPYRPEEVCGKVEVDSSNIMLEDTCCGSKFLITDGSVLEGPSVFPLKQYRTFFDGSTLRVTN